MQVPRTHFSSLRGQKSLVEQIMMMILGAHPPEETH